MQSKWNIKKYINPKDRKRTDKSRQDNLVTTTKTGNVYPTILIVVLNVNELNIPMKRKKLSDLIKKQKSTTCCLKEMKTQFKQIQHRQVKGKRAETVSIRNLV